MAFSTIYSVSRILLRLSLSLCENRNSVFTLIDKILPLLSTLLGAFITYYVTVLSKKNEIKVNAQTKARDDIGYLALRQSQICKRKLRINKRNENCYVSFQGENSCELQTAELLKYLQADKRVFFYERTRNILSLLEKNIQDFENAVDNDVQSLIKRFPQTLLFYASQFFSLYQQQLYRLCNNYQKDFAAGNKNCSINTQRYRLAWTSSKC